ncbi:MAG: CorA family divalent cation transporter [Bacteroidales bacterium]|nr:CorA family divalent cation transporter [Bacteroidales bacterium]
MEKNIYKINQDGVEKIPAMDLPAMERDKSAVYLVDIQSADRHEAALALQKQGLPEEICERLTTPADHIQFEYFGDVLYGELAYFSPQTKKSDYAGTIIYKNILIGIHPLNEGILSALIKPKTAFTEAQKSKISAEFLLYVVILEILSNYGKLIIASREKIETLALDLDNKETDKDISPEVFLESKTRLSLFSRALEKLYFTLTFPPTKDILDNNSLYESYFDYLLKSMGLIKISLKQTEERLESLNDHYHLLLQEKANKRLNFLTVIQAIFVPLTLVVGIYGMNFVNMPELNYKYGYYFSLGAMAFIASVFLFYFYRKGWFN